MFEMMDIFFKGLTAFPVVWKSFKEAWE